MPYQYSMIIWAVMFGYVVFGDVPSMATIVGAAIIIGAGLYIFLRERDLGRKETVVSPPVFYAAPQQCVSEGYWAYQWVPTSYAQSAWVPGGWAPDGTWIESRWEQRVYASGYYQPYWVPGQTYTC